MKVAYIISEISSANGKGDGVRTQAWTWAKGLRNLGIDVSLVGPWDDFDYKSCDLVHNFSYYAGMHLDLAHLKRKFGVLIAVSPIIDSNCNPLVYRLASHCDFPMLHMYSPAGSLRRSVDVVDGWFVRSDYEQQYIASAYGIPTQKIHKVMLSTRLSARVLDVPREDFALLVSYMPSVRKNVYGLIEAAIKYKFNLVLAGGPTHISAYNEMLEKIAPHKNIKALGFVSDEELCDLYHRAKVFVLPSFYEGVGLVALEAAACGCDIVLTNRGAPKEYYNGLAYLVEPTSIDDIGSSVCACLQGKTNQPELKKYICAQHSEEVSAKSLLNAYEMILQKSKGIDCGCV